MLERILIKVLTQLGSFILMKALEYFQKKQGQKLDEEAIDKRVSEVKQVLKEALDGTPLTPEQKNKFKESVIHLVRGNNSSGV